MGAVSYTERDAVTQGDRKFSEVALGWDGEEFVPVGSGTIEEGRVTVAAPAATITQLFNDRYGIPGVTQTTYGFNADGTLFTLGTGDPGSVLNYRGPITNSFNDASYSYNYAPPNYLQLPLERTSVFVAGSFDVTDNHQVVRAGHLRGLHGRHRAGPHAAQQRVHAADQPVHPGRPADPARCPRNPGLRASR